MLDDIQSDMSVFHRVDDIYKMPPTQFFKFAYRLVNYDGIVRANIMAEYQEESEQVPDRVLTPPSDDDQKSAAMWSAKLAGKTRPEEDPFKDPSLFNVTYV